MGEDVILLVATYLKRDVYIYTANDKMSPLIYKPKSTMPSLPPMLMAFYEPGHFRAVSPINTVSSVKRVHSWPNQGPSVNRDF